MTVNVETSKNTFTGDGVVTEFSTTFGIRLSNELAVRVTPNGGVESLKVEGIDYTITGAGPSGVTIEFTVAPAALSAIVLQREVSFTQDVSFLTQGTFSPSVHEGAFDESVYRDQELDRRISALESAGPVGSVVAGDGLIFSGSTLHVIPSTGLFTTADSVGIDYGDAGSMTSVTKASAAGGSVDKPARIDHKHDVTTAAPSAGAVAIGNSAAEGSATTLARSDHTHTVAAGTPVNVTKAANSNGVATTFARSDHKHDISTAAASTLTDSTNAEGSAATLARSDHTHSHGSLTVGTLHAVATTSVNGFMSAADKVKIDALPSRTTSAVAGFKTATVTPTAAISWTPTDNTAETVSLYVAAGNYSSNLVAGYTRIFTTKKKDGVISLIGAVTSPHTVEDAAGWDVAVSVAAGAVTVTVTGGAYDVYWAIQADRITSPFA